MRLRYSYLITILIAAVLSACGFRENISRPAGVIINDPGALPSQYADIPLIFIKETEDHTKIQTSTLDGSQIHASTITPVGEHIRLAPSGDLVVFHRLVKVGEELRSSLWSYDLVSGMESRIILWEKNFLDESLASPAFYPLGRRVIFSVTNYDRDTTGLAAINLDGSDLEWIPITRNTLNIGPIISPDGSKILVVCEGVDAESGQPGFMLCMMDADGSNRTLLTNRGDSHGDSFFTQDSQGVIYVEYENGGPLGIINKPYYHIMSMKDDGTDQQLILAWPQPFSVLAISPDGQGIVVMDDPDANLPTHLYLYDQGTRDLLQLTYFDEFLANWFTGD